MQQRYDPQQHFEKLIEELRNRFRGFKGWRMAAGIVGAFLFISLWSTWFTVQPEETGIIQRFGAVHRTVGPGLHFKFPDGIETVRTVPTARVLKEEFGFRTPAAGGQRTQLDDRATRKCPLCSRGTLT